MAIYRETPKCPFCGKVIAKAKLRFRLPWQQDFYGDDFIGWEYIKHNCKEKKKFLKEHPPIKLSDALNDIINKHKKE
jgi:hypothetical protein